MNSMLPILYSFRRCPYAMRARMALLACQCPVILREVDLKDKPDHLLTISPKGTVPVLQLTDGTVIDESLAIMQWAAQQSLSEAWVVADREVLAWVERNDSYFKRHLDRYKYPSRYADCDQVQVLQQARVYLDELQAYLGTRPYLRGEQFTFMDAALMPFVRQFAGVDNAFFERHYASLSDWLSRIMAGALFEDAMYVTNPYTIDQAEVIMGEMSNE